MKLSSVFFCTNFKLKALVEWTRESFSDSIVGIEIRHNVNATVVALSAGSMAEEVVTTLPSVEHNEQNDKAVEHWPYEVLSEQQVKDLNEGKVTIIDAPCLHKHGFWNDAYM